jgi:predicted nucleic acid-binding protein
MSVLLDSDVVIEILRSRDQVTLSRWEALAISGRLILFSPVSAAEVWTGARPNEHQATERFFDRLMCTPIDYSIGQLAGQFLRQFNKSNNLKIGDAIIAATGVQRQAALWTRNRKHYPMPNLIFY